MDLQHTRQALESAGVSFERGLSNQELTAAEQRFRFRFPPDLREFLAFALPTGPGFPNWREVDDPGLLGALAAPLEGIKFDIEHNSFWPSEWGVRPVDLRGAFEIARTHVDRAPKLIPVIGHRYMPDQPFAADNPVFSVHQTDIIYYGANLENYLNNEYHHYFGTPEYVLPKTIRHIEFWSWLVELNSGELPERVPR